MRLLDQITLWTCSEVDDFLVAIRTLPEYLRDRPSVRNLIEYSLSRLTCEQIRLVIIDSLSAAVHSSSVPALPVALVQDSNKSKGSSNPPKRRRSANTSDPKMDAAYAVVRNIVNTIFKDTLMQLSASGVAVGTAFPRGFA